MQLLYGFSAPNPYINDICEAGAAPPVAGPAPLQTGQSPENLECRGSSPRQTLLYFFFDDVVFDAFQVVLVDGQDLQSASVGGNGPIHHAPFLAVGAHDFCQGP